MSGRLIYLPLGGAGEIGMNTYVYGWGEPGRERLIVVDLGVTFPNMDTTPGVELIFADIAWLAERTDRIEAVFLTHGHEDHVGAIGHLWHRLRVPVHARRFTAAIAARKLEEQGQDGGLVQIAAPWPAVVEAGPFRVGFLPVSHSIPESSALVIDTPVGRVLHTGDFKLDMRPVVGEPFDRQQWATISGGGVQALVCDSTNVFVRHPGRSESVVGPEVERLVAAAEGMVVATTFASNVARLKALAEAGRAAGRSVCLLGRAMRRMVEVAVETGVLTDFPATIGPEIASEIPRQKLMLLVTGSQGERRAASAQLSRGRYLGLSLAEGDTFLFSSKTIPGNERDVITLMNAYSEMGVRVVDDSLDLYHVSGHANRPDLEEMHALVRPRMIVPMHGEHRHLRAHAELARAGGRPAAIAPNGTMLDLTGDHPRVVDSIETGRVYLDGKVQIGQFDGVVRDRLRTAINGHVVVTLVVEEGEALGDPWCELIGLPETGVSRAPLAELLEDDLAKLVGRADAGMLADDAALEEALKRRVRQVCGDEIGKKPEVTVVVSRLTA